MTKLDQLAEAFESAAHAFRLLSGLCISISEDGSQQPLSAPAMTMNQLWPVQPRTGNLAHVHAAAAEITSKALADFAASESSPTPVNRDASAERGPRRGRPRKVPPTPPPAPAKNGAFIPGLRDRIVADLRTHGPTRVLDLAARLEVNNSYASQCCSKLMADGRLRQVSRGVYEAIEE